VVQKHEKTTKRKVHICCRNINYDMLTDLLAVIGEKLF